MLFTLLERQAAERPQHPALVSAKQVLTWGELHEHASRLAAGLITQGVEPGASVALVSRNCPGFVAGFLALARIGAVVVPLNADAKPVEITNRIHASGCKSLLVDSTHSTFAANLVRNGVVSRAWSTDGVEDSDLPSLTQVAVSASCVQSKAERGNQESPPPLPAANSRFLELSTSGTTGPPKQVARTHGDLLQLADSYVECVGITSADRILAVIPLAHGHGLCSTLLSSLQAGATLFIQEKFDRRQTLSLLDTERITVFPAVPFIYSILADTRTREPVDLTALRLCITGGSPLTRVIWNKVHSRLGIRLRQSYGRSETGAIAVNMDDDPESSIESVGWPIRGVKVAVLTPAGATLPANTEGEIAVRSLSDTECPASAISSNFDDRDELIADSDRWTRTGDLGRLDSKGRLFLSGRKGSMINVAGRKVNPEEVEAVLRSFPEVHDAVVLPVSDPYGEEAVKAVVTVNESCNSSELRGYCRTQLADYKIPRTIEFRDDLKTPGPAGIVKTNCRRRS